MQTMICESEDGVGPGCICPGACPSGGMGWGTLTCFGCNEPIYHNQDDACDYPYYDGYWCFTGPSNSGYAGECRPQLWEVNKNIKKVKKVLG